MSGFLLPEKEEDCMQRIKLMTDSASDLPNELAQQLGIEIIPFPIAVDGKGYMEGVDFTPRQFYDIMQNAKETPTTSQIPTVTYCEHYYSAFEKGYTDVILVGISSSASATFLRAQDAVEMFFENCPQAKGKFNIHILDSKTFSLGYGYPMMQAARLVREGKTVEQILAYLTGWLDRIDLYITAFSFEFIKKSGRISCASSIVGEALGIRPIIRIRKGEMKIIAKVRGNNAVVQKMAQIAQQRIAADSPFLMLEGTQPGAREEMEQLIAKSIGKTPDFVSDVGCAVAINSGPKMLGIGFLLNEGEE